MPEGIPLGINQLVTEADVWKPFKPSGYKEHLKQDEKTEAAEANRAVLMETDRQCC